MNTSQPHVTVYLVNHNYGRYIEQAIKSVLDQSLTNYELLIIDDGSTDNSREIIEKYVEHENVYTIFQQNKGLNVTNNIALRASRGKYIMRLDADDYLDENALSVLAGVLDRNPDVGLVFPDFYHVDEGGQVLEVVRRHDFDDVGLYDQPAHGACTMIRRECLEEIGGYDEAYTCQDGWDLWVRFIEHYKVQNANLPLFYYRQHGHSLTKNEERILTTRAEILRKGSEKTATPLECIAIVPIRGQAVDSHSLPLRELGGKKLVDWTIEAAIKSRNISQIIVTSSDEAVIDYVNNAYSEDIIAIEREAKLALPNMSLEETLNHIFNVLPDSRRNFNAIMTLFIEWPFRSEHHIDMAADSMKLFNTDKVIGVRPTFDTFYQHNGKSMTPLRQSEGLRLESSDLYTKVGGFELIKRGHFPQKASKELERVGHVVLDRTAALYLDSEWEWDVAEMLASSISSET